MNYKQTIEFLYAQLAAFHLQGSVAYNAKLDKALLMDTYFNHPHKNYPCIHIAGTNGKGSTAHLIAAALQSAGYKTALFTSPHLLDFSERIKVNGQPINEQRVIDFVAQHKDLITQTNPSFFELSSSLAFLYFAEMEVDIAIIEVGMGGRLDSTNIINPILSIITNIGLDHTEFLGKSLDAIAEEKAGIIKWQTPVVIGEFAPETEVVFVQKANKQEADIYFAKHLLDLAEVNIFQDRQDLTWEHNSANDLSLFYPARFTITLDLLANYQQVNCLTALAALAALAKYSKFKLNLNDISAGFAHAANITNFAGRWQTLAQHPTIICDTGHNAHGLTYLKTQLALHQYKQLLIVFGVVSDKDLDSIIPLLPTQAFYYFCQAQIPRAMPVDVLSQKCTQAGLQGISCHSITDALLEAQEKAANQDLILIGGSTFVVAEALAQQNNWMNKQT